jgi:hypothetical protein
LGIGYLKKKSKGIRAQELGYHVSGYIFALWEKEGKREGKRKKESGC